MDINTISTNHNTLVNFSNWFLSTDLSSYGKLSVGSKENDSYVLGENRPRPFNYNLTYFTDYELYPIQYLDSIRNFTYNIVNTYGVELVYEGYYAQGDYVGWHTNADFSGYNALFTFSDAGNSGFKYVDPDTNSVRVIQDPIGWSIKKTSWTDRTLWHSAYSECNRLTFTFNGDEENINTLISNLS